MFCYKEMHNVSHLHGGYEEALAQWLDTHPDGLGMQLNFCMQLIRAGFSVQKRSARITLYAMAMEQLSVSERLAILLHEMRGEDARSIDVENDNIPSIAWIKEQDSQWNSEPMPFDYNAVLRMSRERVQAVCDLLREALRRCDRRENCTILESLNKREENILRELQRLIDAANPEECADFHLGEDSAFDWNASNYFDEPNPQFFSQREIAADKEPRSHH